MRGDCIKNIMNGADYMSTLLTVTIELKGKTTIPDEDVPEFCGVVHKLIETYGIPSSDIYELRLRSEDLEECIYGYTIDVWNSFSAEEQEVIQDRYEYDLQHPEQEEWFID